MKRGGLRLAAFTILRKNLMSKTQKLPEGEVKVRILRDCQYGKCDDVITLDAALAASLDGVVDADPAAVAYAESLAK